MKIVLLLFLISKIWQRTECTPSQMSEFVNFLCFAELKIHYLHGTNLNIPILMHNLYVFAEVDILGTKSIKYKYYIK